jgi:hypothetical protein
VQNGLDDIHTVYNTIEKSAVSSIGLRLGTICAGSKKVLAITGGDVYNY